MFVEVSEEGTEAAGATGIDIRMTSLAETEEFVCDRPFVFMIRDRETGSTLFAGKYADPAEQPERVVPLAAQEMLQNILS